MAMEKAKLVAKLEALNKDNAEARVKWWSFCKVHAEGQLTPKDKDVAFLETFFASYELGDIVDEPGCPFKAGGNTNDLAKRRVFVGGMPRGTGEAELRALFEPLGTIEKVEIKTDENGQPRGFGFVNFEDPEVAEFVTTTAKEANIINGKWIDCKLASESGGKSGGNPMAGMVLKGPGGGASTGVPPAGTTGGMMKGGGGGAGPYGSNGGSWGGDSWGGGGCAKGGKGGKGWGGGGGDSWGGDSWGGGKDGGKGGMKGGMGGMGGKGKDGGGKSFGKDGGKGGGKDGGKMGGKMGGGKKGGGWGGDSWGGGGGGW